MKENIEMYIYLKEKFVAIDPKTYYPLRTIDSFREANISRGVKKFAQEFAGTKFLPKIVKINEITQGAICTVLLAKEYFNNSDSVIIKDCDQIPNWVPEHFFEFVTRKKADGAIINIHTDQPHYSFCRVNSNGEII